jgi:hypothetical protein
MGCTAQRFVSALIVVVATSCGGDDAPAETGGRPVTFGDACMFDGLDPCDDPFVCLELPDFSTQAAAKSICSVACQKPEDCPAWEAVSGGVCKSQCVRQICRDVCR